MIRQSSVLCSPNTNPLTGGRPLGSTESTPGNPTRQAAQQLKALNVKLYVIPCEGETRISFIHEDPDPKKAGSRMERAYVRISENKAEDIGHAHHPGTPSVREPFRVIRDLTLSLKEGVFDSKAWSILMEEDCVRYALPPTSHWKFFQGGLADVVQGKGAVSQFRPKQVSRIPIKSGENETRYTYYVQDLSLEAQKQNAGMLVRLGAAKTPFSVSKNGGAITLSVVAGFEQADIHYEGESVGGSFSGEKTFIEMASALQDIVASAKNTFLTSEAASILFAGGVLVMKKD